MENRKGEFRCYFVHFSDLFSIKVLLSNVSLFISKAENIQELAAGLVRMIKSDDFCFNRYYNDKKILDVFDNLSRNFSFAVKKAITVVAYGCLVNLRPVNEHQGFCIFQVTPT